MNTKFLNQYSILKKHSKINQSSTQKTAFVKCSQLVLIPRDAPLEELVLWGMGEEELRERSWHPQRWYGVGHVLMCAEVGSWAAEIDALRTMAREVELCACRAFDGPDGTTRPDMVRVLDRLSSALYVLIYHHLPEGYDKTAF